jgi:hypothetical protein
MLKLSVKDGPNLPTGWETVTITKAVDGEHIVETEDGEHKGTRYIDLFFEGLPENLNCRLWSRLNEDTGEDFGIGNVFRFTNAGVTDNGEGMLDIDDNVNHLHGKKAQILFYINQNGYTDAAPRIVPTTDSGIEIAKIDALKAKAESWVRNKISGTHTNGSVTSTATTEEAVPF